MKSSRSRGKVVRLRIPKRDLAVLPTGVSLARVSSVQDGKVFVVSEGNQPVPSDTTVLLTQADVGRQVTVVPVEGSESGLVVTGLVRTASELARSGSEGIDVKLDGRTLLLSAQERIELRCGDSVVVLSKDGKVLIKGVQVVSRASALNRIKGGSVQIN